MKNKISDKYSLIIGFIEDRIKENKNNISIIRRLENLLNDAKELSQIDFEKHDVHKQFVEDYD